MKEQMLTFSIRIPESLREQLQRKADEEGRSLNNLIVFILKRAIADGR